MLLGLLIAEPAMASDSTTSPSPSPTQPTATTTTESTGLIVTGVEHGDDSTSNGSSPTGQQGSASEGAAPSPPGQWVRSTACDTVGAAGCLSEYACPDGSAPVVWIFELDSGGSGGSYSQCSEDPEPTATTPPQVDIPGEALAAFKRVELPASTIIVQPPGGETLVNFKTLLSTQAERHQINVHLDKVKMDLVLEVWPSHFLWHHGDGTTQESTTPGLAWTEGADVDAGGFITHVYAQKLKAARVSVDTTWSAQFKAAGAPAWRPVDGTVSIAGAPVTLTVREATPELVTDPS